MRLRLSADDIPEVGQETGDDQQSGEIAENDLVSGHGVLLSISLYSVLRGMPSL